jgi:polyisoprenoid-binding protein YceI
MEWGRLGWTMSVSLLTAQDTSTLAPARPLEFELNSFHSRVEFSVPFMKLTSVKGSFEDFSGLLLYDRDRPTRSSVTFVIRSASLHTGNTLRDKHLRSDDFFDVERYPTIVYRSERIEARGSDRYLVRGSLTMHGTTRRVGLPIRVRHRLVSDESGVDYLGFDGAIRLDWREFGIPGGNRNNGWFQPSKMLVNDSVNIALSMEADRRVPSRIHYPALDSARQVVERAGVQELIRRYNRVAAGHSDSVESFARPLRDLGLALVETGRAKEGLAVLQLNLRAHAGSAEAAVALARAQLATGDSVAAGELYRQALVSDSTNPAAMEMLRHLVKSAVPTH